VTHGEWATRDCQACHGDDSRVAAPILLAGDPPGGVRPDFDSDDPVFQNGDIVTGEDGALLFAPDLGEGGVDLYVLGHSRSKVVDWIGIGVLLATLGGVFAHGGLRVVAARRRAHHEPELRDVYMYTVYERLWHWLQSAAILLLVVTGLIIHKPDLFGAFSFRYIVQVHNIVAAILVANAGLALFYHVASGEIRQFLPEPRGFFNQAIEQAKFYLGGIFNGKEHPFEKTPQRKLNPLQQITYLGLLNVLLPIQIVTGALMWGAQRWPEIAARLGGLPFLAPVHTLTAWLFASFVVMHVYLTTTGHEPLASIRGMVLGWDEVEAGGSPVKAGTD
jgi:thiosulfate reductase cytochrome b subunit